MAFGQRVKEDYFLDIILKDVYHYGHDGCDFRTVKMVYDPSSTTILEATQMSFCRFERTLTSYNTADEFLLIRTNSDDDLILGYETIEQPNSMACSDSADKLAKYCDWIDHMGHRDREDSLYIRISDFKRTNCQCKSCRLL